MTKYTILLQLYNIFTEKQKAVCLIDGWTSRFLLMRSIGQGRKQSHDHRDLMSAPRESPPHRGSGEVFRAPESKPEEQRRFPVAVIHARGGITEQVGSRHDDRQQKIVLQWNGDHSARQNKETD